MQHLELQQGKPHVGRDTDGRLFGNDSRCTPARTVSPFVSSQPAQLNRAGEGGRRVSELVVTRGARGRSYDPVRLNVAFGWALSPIIAP